MEPVFLQVKPTLVGSKIQLEMCNGTDCGKSNGTYPTVTLAKDSGSHVFIVSIVDPTQGVTFDTDALWVKTSHGSPSHKMLDSANQIGSFTRANDTTIFFTDQNNNDPNSNLTLGYSLHFNGPTGQLVIDPDIKNGGGTSFNSNYMAIGALVLGVATLATILFVAFQQGVLKHMIAGLIGAPRPK